MYKVIFIIVVFLFHISCNNYTTIVDLEGNLISRRYKNGEYINYYSNGVIKEIRFSKNTCINDTVISYLKLDTIRDFNNKFYSVYFDEKGYIKKKGAVDTAGIKVGIWNFYRNNKPLVDIEFFNIEGKEFVNRTWSRDSNSIRNNLYSLKTKNDTFNIGEKFRLKCFLIYPYISYESDVSVLIPKKKYFDVLKDNFNNAREVEYDTFMNVAEILKKERVQINEFDNLGVPVDFIFSKPGTKKIKGIILERFENKDSTIINELFFTKKVFIKNPAERSQKK